MAAAYIVFKYGNAVKITTTGRATELPHGNPAGDGGVISKFGASPVTGK